MPTLPLEVVPSPDGGRPEKPDIWTEALRAIEDICKRPEVAPQWDELHRAASAFGEAIYPHIAPVAIDLVRRLMVPK